MAGINQMYEERQREDRENQDIDFEKVWPFLAEIDYVAYLIVRGEIKDKVVVGYYRNQITGIIEYLLRKYGPTYQRLTMNNSYRNRNIDKLIMK